VGAHMRTVGTRRLVIELKRFREAAGLTGEQVAEQMSWSAAKVYRIEGDRVRVLARDVQRLLSLYGIGREQRDAVLELARLARAKDWWHQYSGVIPEWFQFYVGLEAAASAMQEYHAELVTGLLQTLRPRRDDGRDARRRRRGDGTPDPGADGTPETAHRP
jgi:transcriptional regulator with XRE-family HTH domain